MKETAKWKPVWTITKFNEGESEPYEVVTIEGNVLLNEGINAIWGVLSGDSSVPAYNNANAHIGVGDDNTASDATQTGLLGSNKAYMAMDTGYPSYGSQQIKFKSTFGTDSGNFSWNEFTVSNTSDDNGANLNRLVSTQGTKTQGQVWQCELTISLE